MCGGLQATHTVTTTRIYGEGAKRWCAVCHLRGGADTFAPEKLSLCGGCRQAAYCSQACQKSDWPTHRPVCKQFKQFKSEFARLNPDVKL